MNLEEYLNRDDEGPRTIRDILTPYGFSVRVHFGYNNKDIWFCFRDSITEITIFVIVAHSQEEAINLMGLLEFLIEEDIREGEIENE